MSSNSMGYKDTAQSCDCVLELTREGLGWSMNNNVLEQHSIVPRLLRILSVLLLPTLLLVFLLCGLSRRTRAKPTGRTDANLVPNPGFEEQELGTSSPVSWCNEGPNPPYWGYMWPGSEPHGGDASAGIYVNGWYTGEWRSDFFSVSAGREYTFSGWIKADDLLGKAYLTLGFYSSRSLESLIRGFDSAAITSSSDWTKVVTGSVDAPDGAQYGLIHCKLMGQGAGTAWFDDIFAQPVERPILEIDKSDAPDPVEPGQRLVYIVTYTNAGDMDATRVVITETYDVNVEFYDADPAPYSDNRTWKVDTLGPQRSDFIVITVTVNSPLTDGLVLTNLVEIDCDENVFASDTTTTVVHVPCEVYLPTVLRSYIPPLWYRGTLPVVACSVAACPASPKDIVYAGTNGQGVYRSTTGGETWGSREDGINLTIMGLAVHPSDCHTAYAATWGGGIYKRIGTSWSSRNSGLTDLYLSGAMVLHPNEPDRIYIGTYGSGVFVSADGGNSWTKTGLNDAEVGSLYIAADPPHTAYAGTNRGVFRSTDGGNTWSDTGSGLPEGTQVWALVKDPAGQIYAGTDGKGLYRLVGYQWEPMQIDGHTDFTIYGLKYVQDSLYVATLDNGVYRLRDDTWRPFNDGLSPLPSIFLMSSTEQRLYIATLSGVWWYPLP